MSNSSKFFQVFEFSLEEDGEMEGGELFRYLHVDANLEGTT